LLVVFRRSPLEVLIELVGDGALVVEDLADAGGDRLGIHGAGVVDHHCVGELAAALGFDVAGEVLRLQLEALAVAVGLTVVPGFANTWPLPGRFAPVATSEPSTPITGSAAWYSTATGVVAIFLSICTNARGAARLSGEPHPFVGKSNWSPFTPY
jgi:hypothetical protein